MRLVWRILYSMIGKKPPSILWRNEYGSRCWFSRGYNPNGKLDAARWVRLCGTRPERKRYEVPTERNEAGQNGWMS